MVPFKVKNTVSHQIACLHIVKITGKFGNLVFSNKCI